jgi:signal recognition particle GTPase
LFILLSQEKKVTSVDVYKHSDVVSSLDLKNTNFKLAGFTGISKKIIGDPEIPFQIMIYGPGGKGKSTFGVKFATYLSNVKDK